MNRRYLSKLALLHKFEGKILDLSAGGPLLEVVFVGILFVSAKNNY